VNDDALAELAHNLKTPIAVIAGYAELLAVRDDEETRTTAALQISAAARRLTDAVNSLLGLEDDGDESALDGRRTAQSPSPRSRVVVIDDDVFVRRLLRMTLPAEEFEIAEAPDGDVALALAEVQVPDLVLLDWRMPTMSGDTVLVELKERFPDVVVIVLTAEGAQRSRAEALGADAFLTKPFSPLELLRTIEQLLEARTANGAAPLSR
jgi:CheY-like chemotaxis protein